jgi:hypothetical protein
MICKFCRSHILESGKAWGDHHNDASAFEISAGFSNEKQRCIFCWRLAQNIVGETGSTIASWIKPTEPDAGQAPAIPVYRWSLCKAVKIDETEDYFVLAFRAVLIDEAMVDRYKKRDEVPDATFYLLHEQG